MRSSPWLLCACLTTTLACTGPERDAFPEDPTGTSGATTSPSATGSTGSSPTSSGSPASTASTASSSDGGGGEGPGGPGGDGPGPGPGGGGVGGDTTSSGGAPPTCGDGDGVCVPEPPVGWTGPFAVFENPTGIPTPSCAIGNYPEHLTNFVGEIDEGSATCACDCEDATGIACFGNATVCYHSNINQCFQLCGGSSQSLAPNVCDTPDFTIQYAAVFPPTPDDMGTCAEIVTDEIVEATWGVETVACTGADPVAGTCDDGAECVPIPSDDAAQLCILHANDVDCPDVFTEKRARYSSITDGRSCTECVCEDPVSNCGHVDYTNGCSGLVELVASIPAGGCGDHRNGEAEEPSNVTYQQQPSGQCGHNTTEVQGEIERDGPATVCCIPAL